MEKTLRNVITPEDFPNWVKITQFMSAKLKEDSDEMLPWFFIQKSSVTLFNLFVGREYHPRILFIFASRDDSMDVACFERTKPGKVVIIEGTDEPTYYEGPEFISFEAWYNYAIKVKPDDRNYTDVPGVDFNPTRE